MKFVILQKPHLLPWKKPITLKHYFISSKNKKKKKIPKSLRFGLDGNSITISPHYLLALGECGEGSDLYCHALSTSNPSFQESSILPWVQAVQSGIHYFFSYSRAFLDHSKQLWLKAQTCPLLWALILVSQWSCLLQAVTVASAHGRALFLNLLPENWSSSLVAEGKRQQKPLHQTCPHTFAPRSRCTFGLTVAYSNQVLSWKILTDTENNNVFHLQWNVLKGKMPGGSFSPFGKYAYSLSCFWLQWYLKYF